MLGIFSDQVPLLPKLVPVRSDESRYGLTVLGRTSESLFMLWHAPIEPWSVPNGTVDQLDDTMATNPAKPAYAVGPSAIEDRYALMIDGATGHAVQLFRNVDPGFDPDSEYLLSDQQGAPRSLFVARRFDDAGPSYEHLLGYEMRDGDRRRLIVRLVSPSAGTPEHPQAAACASEPIAAAAVGVPGAFYVATSSSRALGACDDPADAFGPATRVQVTFYNEPLGVVLNPVEEWQESGRIVRIALTLGEGALWVTYAVDGGGDFLLLRVMRVGLTGGVLSGPFDVAKIARPGAFAATSFGSHLAIASREVTTMGQLTVPVRVLSTVGDVEESFTIVPEGVDDVAIAAEPTGKRLLVALTDEDPSAADRVWLGRYGCE
ncbi:Hypothetical protein A7982_05245 [Minicystis rosea]|nr:Hypothetical protein A7982_05245 [Minicystis rosea]